MQKNKKIWITGKWDICFEEREDDLQINDAHDVIVNNSFTHMAGIAMTALRNSQIELGDHVLVAGQGVMGNFAAQLAQLQGANIIVTGISDARLGISNACGIRQTLKAS